MLPSREDGTGVAGRRAISTAPAAAPAMATAIPVQSRTFQPAPPSRSLAGACSARTVGAPGGWPRAPGAAVAGGGGTAGRGGATAGARTAEVAPPAGDSHVAAGESSSVWVAGGGSAPVG